MEHSSFARIAFAERIGVNMHIQKTRIEFAALCVLAGATSIIPAHANGFARSTGNLPDASHVYTAPLQADIVDMRPRVIDTRKPEDNTTYVINVGPPPAANNQVIQVGGDGTPGGGKNGNIAPINIRRNSLPFAGPQSNIPAVSPLARQLPPGQVAHTMSTKANLLLHPATGGQKASNGAPISTSTGFRKTPVATYEPSHPSAGSGAGISGERVATVRLKGDLLKKNPH